VNSCLHQNLPVTDNVHSDEHHEEKEEGNVDSSPTYPSSCYSSETHLLTQGDLNDLARLCDLSFKTS
jgi:hypothetical protein